MKKLNIASSITNIDDTYIQEALDMPMTEADSIPQKRTFWQKLSDVVNSPWGVACVCAVVALGVLVGIVAAGRNAPSATPPIGFGGDTNEPQHPPHEETIATEGNAENFAMIYFFENGTSLKRGETYNIQTTIQNNGKSFTYSGSSTGFFAEATLIYHSGQTAQVESLIGFEINAMFPITDDYVKDFEIPTGKVHKHTGHFIIPADAPVGQYDLKLSYKDEYVIYKNAVNIYGENRFAFTYEGLDTIPSGIGQFNAGGSLTLTASVTNLGESFKVYEDHSDSFVPTVKFVCRETGYTFHATTPQSDDITTFIVGELETGTSFYHADIPEMADAGVYDLVLSYSNESRTFYEVLTVVNTIPEESRAGYESGVTPTEPSVAPMSEEDALKIAIAYMEKEKIKLPSKLNDESHWNTDIAYYKDIKKYHITFRYVWASIVTKYQWDVLVDATNQEETYVDVMYQWDENTFFMRYPEDNVYAAIARLEFPFFPFNGSSTIYYEEIDGNLYICKEFSLSDESASPDKNIISREEVLLEDNGTNTVIPLLVPQQDNILNITVTSNFPNTNYQFEGDKADAIVDYLLDLNLISDFRESLDVIQRDSSYKIVILYEDGTSLTIYHFVNKFIRVVGSQWYKMDYDEAEAFASLLYELSTDNP